MYFVFLIHVYFLHLYREKSMFVTGDNSDHYLTANSYVLLM